MSDKKLTLTKTIKENYRYITKPLLEVKSAFIAACADIDRYIRLATGCEIREELDQRTVEKLNDIYPYLSGMTVDQWNRLMLIFLNIRNDNAHLHQNKPIFIDPDILGYLRALVEPEMAVISEGNELTVYGAYYVLVFLQQRFQIWNFVSSLMRAENFTDMSKRRFNDFMVESQHHLQERCGIGKPIGNSSSKDMLELVFINDTLRRELTSVFLGLEGETMHRDIALTFTPSFRSILRKIALIEEDEELSKRLVELRNAWFHGHWTGDEITLLDGTKKTFDLCEAVETLAMLRNALKGSERYDSVTHQIESFGKALLDFKALRLVELSYKVLDSRLINVNKLEKRLDNLAKAFSTLTTGDERLLPAASSLLGDGPLNWYLTAAKFSNADWSPRSTVTDELRVILLHSETGFDIGRFHTKRKDLVLCDIDLPKEFSLTVNGKRLAEYPLSFERELCPRITIHRATKDGFVNYGRVC